MRDMDKNLTRQTVSIKLLLDCLFNGSVQGVKVGPLGGSF